jgi:hypothetical protein
MKPYTRDRLIIALEAGLFIIMLIVIWLDEFIDLPYLLLGAPRTPYRVQEYLFETASILIVGVIVITLTIFMQYRFRNYERFLRVCAWCRKVWVDDQWVCFEEYVERSQSLRSSHGICEECQAKLISKAEKRKSEEKKIPDT